MNTLHDILVTVGIASVGLLWVFCVAGALQTLWDTFGEHSHGLIEAVKKRIQR